MAQRFFPRNRIKTSVAEKYHFIPTMTVQTTNMKIGIAYSIDTWSPKTAYVDRCFQRYFGKSCAWLGRADLPGKAGLHKSNPGAETRGGEGGPRCKAQQPPAGRDVAAGQPRPTSKRGSAPTPPEARGRRPTLGSARPYCKEQCKNISCYMFQSFKS